MSHNLGKDAVRGAMFGVPAAATVLVTIYTLLWLTPQVTDDVGDHVQCPANTSLRGCVALVHAFKQIAHWMTVATYVLLCLSVVYVLLGEIIFRSNDRVARRWEIAALWQAIVATVLGGALVFMEMS